MGGILLDGRNLITLVSPKGNIVRYVKESSNISGQNGLECELEESGMGQMLIDLVFQIIWTDYQLTIKNLDVSVVAPK